LLSAFNQLVGKFANARLVIAGDGNFKNALEQIKCNWGKVTFTGNIPYSELEKLYQIATIGIIPSIYEQCSYVALEMMKFGLPVVVTAVPGLRELYINGENALVLPLHKSNNIKMRLEYNEDQITVALSTLLGDKDLLHKISKNARVNWELYYTAARMGDATISQYKKLLIQTRNESTTRDNEFYQ